MASPNGETFSKIWGELEELGFKEWMTVQEISSLINVGVVSLYKTINRLAARGEVDEYIKTEPTLVKGKIYTTRYIHMSIVLRLVFRQTSFSNEVRGFHPLVETDLQMRYSDVKHHVPCDAGIIDFVCPSGEIDILIECKVEPFKTSHLRQINKYLRCWRRDIGDCLGVLVYPESLREQTDTPMIGRLGLDVMFVEVPEGHYEKMDERRLMIHDKMLTLLVSAIDPLEAIAILRGKKI